jgi:hypothetical protein
LLDRVTEIAALEEVLAAVRDGLSGVLVLRGEAGIGKTALLECAAGRAEDMRLARVAGVQAEMGLGFAGLHQLLMLFLDGLGELPEPQQQALASAFGLVAGPAPDRFLVGLAALTLLTDAAAQRPVLCLVDDAQWLDQVSVEVLGFIARRLYADPVGMVFTVREEEGHAAALADLPELVLAGLPAEAAAELLATSTDGRVDGRVSTQVVSGVAGNPLALVELAAELWPPRSTSGSSRPTRSTRPCTASTASTRSAASAPPATWPIPSPSCSPRPPAGSPAPSGTSTAASWPAATNRPRHARAPAQPPGARATPNPLPP